MDQDREFYEKVKIPDPTFCPVCRVQRRMAWRNDRSFSRRKCDKTGTIFVSHYSPNTPFPVYKADEWWKDDWDAKEYGQEFDFKRPFFEQWHELMNKVPRLGIDIVHCENSDYCNYCGDDKNCYLDIAGEANEDCYFNLFTKYSKNCADCTFVYHSELLYECINCYNAHNCRYSIYLEECHDCVFCFDLKGCSDCLFCNNLRHKKHHIFNEPFTKEEYEKKLAELNLNSYSSLQEQIKKWKENMKKAVHRHMYSLNSEDCTGNNIKNSKNCQFVFNVVNCWDCKFLYDVLDAKDCYDLNYSLYKPEVACELISTLAMRYSAYSMASHYCGNVYYCDQCNNSSFLFGCIALNRGKYCILNKQYTKVKYDELFPKIIEHMTKTGEWGEFFPAALSPWAYNETVAQEYIPISKEEAIKKGYPWKDSAVRDFRPQTFEIPDDIEEVSDSIVNELLACGDCKKNYKIIAQELKLYRQFKLPIPRKCSDCRHQTRIKIRNPRWLWKRKCAKCEVEMKTSYATERPEKVYCEKCYLSIVV